MATNERLAVAANCLGSSHSLNCADKVWAAGMAMLLFLRSRWSPSSRRKTMRRCLSKSRVTDLVSLVCMVFATQWARFFGWTFFPARRHASNATKLNLHQIVSQTRDLTTGAASDPFLSH